ncbi:DUF6881 domain-containing protein [Nocardia tengchongensis]|uniref:DUF6881 domain-containing protein n=1 Tax=Nocardia tengchongensis TaxID=2055889 RepID=UPI003620D431
MSAPMIAERQLLAAIVSRISADVPPGWTTLEVRIDIVGKQLNFFLSVESLPGPFEVGVPHEVMDLRQVMYVPRRGTWFTMWLTITSDGLVGVRFGRDRPNVREQLAQAVTDELRLFPRDSVPGWMRVELGEHQEAVLGHGWFDDTTASTCCNSEEGCDCIDRAEAVSRAADFVPDLDGLRHLKIVHHSEFDHIAVSFSEILANGREWRRVELFRDGGGGLAAMSGRTEFTYLTSGLTPSIAEISSYPQLSAEAITSTDFQTEWLAVGGW